MTGAQKTAAFAAVNPYCQIPALEDGAVKMGESAAIIRYLARTYKPELLPASAVEGAKVNFAMEVMGHSLGKLHQGVVYPALGFGAVPAAIDLKAAAAAYAAGLEKFASVFLADGPFVAGASLSIAEYKCAPYFYAAMCCQDKVAGFVVPKRISAYVENVFKACPEMKKLATDHGGASIKEYVATRPALPTE
ncbi:hypothetical protein M885DRAFT_546052 [Pelagophyceae sp. CCMP2097]|nr:hypothetical protein M885DRAFT_546052 [Pelagophyceae sp. CCMP2097]